MATRKWDAYRTLNITTRGDSSATCVGKNMYGKRCRWDIDHTDYEEVVGLLNTMELQPPENAYGSLRELAELSLCRKFHREQAFEVAQKWRIAVQDAAKEYEEVAALRQRVRLLEKKLKSSNIEALETECRRVESSLVKHQSELDSLKTHLQEAWQISEDHKRQEEKYRRDLLVSEERIATLQQEMAVCQSDLERDRDDKTKFLEEVTSLKLQLGLGRQEPSLLSSGLQDVNAAVNALLQEIRRVGTDIEHERGRCQDFENEVSRAKALAARYTMDIETLRAELATEKSASIQLQRDLTRTKEELSSASLALAESQADLALAYTGIEDLKASSADMQRTACASIAHLKDQVASLRTHPFRSFLLVIRTATMGWAKRVLKKVNRVFGILT